MKSLITFLFLPCMVASFGAGAMTGYTFQPQIKGVVQAYEFVKGVTQR